MTRREAGMVVAERNRVGIEGSSGYKMTASGAGICVSSSEITFDYAPNAT